MPTLISHATPGSRIAFLDYLRILAFSSVLIGHKFYPRAIVFVSDESIHATPRWLLSHLLPLFEGGGAGVVIFFLISGYIIAHILQTEKTIEFIIKRIARIYPLYIVAVIAQSILAHEPLNWMMVPQLLLIGDFFDAPYTLGGVEWTLRVEVVFYGWMALLSSLGLIRQRCNLLPYVLLIATLILGLIAPLPSADIWTRSYETMYMPFLFLGVCIYLREIRQVGVPFLLALIGLVFWQYFVQSATYQKAASSSHFATVAFLIFILTWLWRRLLQSNSVGLFFSNLAYAVYLSHQWAFDAIKRKLTRLHLVVIDVDLQALAILLALCYLAGQLIEKPAIRLVKAWSQRSFNAPGSKQIEV